MCEDATSPRCPMQLEEMKLTNRQVEEIAQSVAEHVKEHEPGALQYQWFRVLGAEKPTIAVWET